MRRLFLLPPPRVRAPLSLHAVLFPPLPLSPATSNIPFSLDRYCKVGHSLWRHGCPSCECVSDDSLSGREMRTSGGIPDGVRQRSMSFWMPKETRLTRNSGKKTRTATAGTGRIVTMLISLKPVCSAFSVIRNIPAKMFIIGLPTRCRRLSMKVGVVHAVFSIHWKGCTSVFTIPEVPSGIRQVLAHVEPAQAYGV